MKYFIKQLSISKIIKGVTVCSFLALGTSELAKAIGTADDPIQAPQIPQQVPPMPQMPTPQPPSPQTPR